MPTTTTTTSCTRTFTKKKKKHGSDNKDNKDAFSRRDQHQQSKLTAAETAISDPTRNLNLPTESNWQPPRTVSIMATTIRTNQSHKAICVANECDITNNSTCVWHAMYRALNNIEQHEYRTQWDKDKSKQHHALCWIEQTELYNQSQRRPRHPAAIAKTMCFRQKRSVGGSSSTQPGSKSPIQSPNLWGNHGKSWKSLKEFESGKWKKWQSCCVKGTAGFAVWAWHWPEISVPGSPWRNYIGTGVALEPKLQRLASNPQTLRTPSQALGFKVRTHAGKHSSCVLLQFGRGQFRTSSYTSAIWCSSALLELQGAFGISWMLSFAPKGESAIE